MLEVQKIRAKISILTWVLAVALGAGLAWAVPKSTAASDAGVSSVSSVAAAQATVRAPAVSSSSSSALAFGSTSAMAPVPSGAAVPRQYLPPGSDYPDRGPSQAIFPPQRLTVRFDHRSHAALNLTCLTCHPADRSTVATDRLVPRKHDVCIDCHEIDEAAPRKIASPVAACDGCHLGARVDPSGAVTVARTSWPTPNLKMNHRAHHQKGVTCERCHGDVAKLELATRDQLPRMRGCLSCHQRTDRAPSGACLTCHLSEKDGVLRTMWPSGAMLPPSWLRNARHGSDWMFRHRVVAGADSAFCGNCHRESQCVDCHDGRQRPRDVHPNDWLSMHAVAAKFDQPRCASCHQTSSFCGVCHARAGLSPSGPKATLDSARVHPDPSVWSGPRRGPGHHAMEAQKNLSACVSCHVERDCVVCHGTRRVGGGGQSPHGPGFEAHCGSMLERNPRPCLVCHEPADVVFQRCL